MSLSSNPWFLRLMSPVRRERPRSRPERRGRQRLRLEQLETRDLPSGFWTPLTHLAPDGIGTMMLLSDGTVMAQNGNLLASANWNQWYQLTPDSSGNYVTGAWSILHTMGNQRLYYGSNVLPNGKVFLVGGEYSGPTGTQNWINTGEIYNPLTNLWSPITNYPQPNFGDDPTAVLPDGRILAGFLNGPQTSIYDPATNTWSAGATKLHTTDRSDEESWVKLPDNSILTYDIYSTLSSGVGQAERYIPAAGGPGSWVDASGSGTGAAPANLSSAALGDELGAAVRLPDGRVFILGATGHTAYYTPATNSWAVGPDIPGGLGADDAPAAVLPNGHVLLAADRGPIGGTFTPPTSVFEFDPSTNTYTNVTPPSSTLVLSGSCYVTRMLVLPNGQVLMAGTRNTPQGSTADTQLAVRTTNEAPNPAWRPGVLSLRGSTNSFTLTGTQLNGLSEGAAYGDDAEMSSNYPIVRLRDASGVSYARTSGWSSTGVSAVGDTTPEAVQLTQPVSRGIYLLRPSPTASPRRPC
jgi:hypothetical protein